MVNEIRITLSHKHAVMLRTMLEVADFDFHGDLLEYEDAWNATLEQLPKE